MLNLIPMPKHIDIHSGTLREKNLKTVSVSDDRLCKALEAISKSGDGADFEINVGNEKGESYTLDITPDKVIISARAAAGAFYAIQTLRQLLTHDRVPCLHIEDEPDFEYRGFYQDVTRGKVPKVDTIKQLIDRMAYFKLNSLQLYIEHTFEFKEFSDSIDRTGYLTAAEIKELDDYCYMNFIEFIPSIATFGHLYELLQKDRYKELCELEDFEPNHVLWFERMSHHTIDPTNPRSAELITGMIDQYSQLFRSNKFNICGDETFDLSHGRHKGMNTGRLYVDYIKKLIEHLKSEGKTVMMWADILLAHPEVISELPDDVIFLNWNYEPDAREEIFEPFEKAGLTQIGCPAVATYAWITENVKTEEKNISWMTELAHKHGAWGILNTNWGDFGNPCSLEVSLYGMVYGAARSWSVKTTAGDEFKNSINHLLYGSENGADAIFELGILGTYIDWRDFAKLYSNHIFEDQLEVDPHTVEEIEEIQAGCMRLIDRYSCQNWKNDEYREEILITAEGVAVVAELMGIVLGFDIERKTDTRKWLKKFKAKWRLKNKESELCEIEKVFMGMEKLSRSMSKTK